MTVQQKITKLLEYRFDKIYVLTYIDNPARVNAINEELIRAGISECYNLEYVYEYKTIFDADMYANVGNIIDSRNFKLYRLIKTAVETGNKQILVITDYTRFINDVQTLYHIFENMPMSDICLFDKCISINNSTEYKQALKQFMDKYSKNIFITGDFNEITSSGMFSLSDKGMRFITENVAKLCRDNKRIPDIILSENENMHITRSYSLINASIQDSANIDYWFLNKNEYAVIQ